jgi:hypothetical protein
MPIGHASHDVLMSVSISPTASLIESVLPPLLEVWSDEREQGDGMQRICSTDILSY